MSGQNIYDHYLPQLKGSTATETRTPFGFGKRDAGLIDDFGDDGRVFWE